MLRQRVLTALVLFAVLAAVLASPWPLTWPLFLAVVATVTLWEWLRLTSRDRPAVAWTGALLALAVLVYQSLIWKTQPYTPEAFQIVVVISVLVWLGLVPFKLYYGLARRTADLPFWGLFAPICLYSTWGALVIWWIQGGIWLLISLLALVWVADIFAYFGGKRWGRNKLAPAISPGKTREGALVGLVGVLVWTLISSQFDGSYGQILLVRYSWVGLVFFALLLGVVSIMGDLFESLLKRQAEVKDSSALLPGHGGFYDRVDAVVAVVPLAYLIIKPELF